MKLRKVLQTILLAHRNCAFRASYAGLTARLMPIPETFLRTRSSFERKGWLCFYFKSHAPPRIDWIDWGEFFPFGQYEPNPNGYAPPPLDGRRSDYIGWIGVHDGLSGFAQGSNKLEQKLGAQIKKSILLQQFFLCVNFRYLLVGNFKGIKGRQIYEIRLRRFLLKFWDPRPLNDVVGLPSYDGGKTPISSFQKVWRS